MYRTGDVIDNNDLAYVIERFGNPRRVLPAPISRFKVGEHKGRPKINPHVSSFIMKDGRTVSVFHIKPIYYLHVNGEWRPLSEVTNYHGNRKLILNNKWEQIEPWYLRWLMKRCEIIGGQVLIPWRFDNVPVREGQEIYFTVTTKYPDPNPETSTVDGDVRQSGAGATWATIIAGAGDVSVDDSTTLEAAQFQANAGSGWDNLIRGITLFDTSSIPDTDTIDSAIYSIYGINKADPGSNTPNINVYSSAPASNTALAAGDFDSLGSTAFATAITYANWSEAGYNDFTVNATGLSNISKTSITKFGTRNASYDVAATSPTFGAGQVTRLRGSAAETADTTQDPKLAVTHSAAASGPVNVKTYIGLASASTKTVNGLAIASVKTWDNLG